MKAKNHILINHVHERERYAVSQQDILEGVRRFGVVFTHEFHRLIILDGKGKGEEKHKKLKHDDRNPECVHPARKRILRAEPYSGRWLRNGYHDRDYWFEGSSTPG